MITKEEYKKIKKNWKGRIYTEDWIFPRLKLFLEQRHYLEGKKVLEVGCNAGIFALEMSKFVESYVGLEKEGWYYEQALETLKHIKKNNVTFYNTDIINMPKDIEYNAFVGLFVLYHFCKPEVKIWVNEILPKCNTAFVQLRIGKRKTIKNKYHFEKVDNVTDLLIKNGFRIKVCTMQPVKAQFWTIVGVR